MPTAALLIAFLKAPLLSKILTLLLVAGLIAFERIRLLHR